MEHYGREAVADTSNVLIGDRDRKWSTDVRRRLRDAGIRVILISGKDAERERRATLRDILEFRARVLVFVRKGRRRESAVARENDRRARLRR